MKKYLFAGDEEGKKRYSICMQAVLLNNPQQGGRAVQVSEWDEVVSLLKAIKKIGAALPPLPNGTVLYDLQDGGGEMELEKSEHKLLISFLKQPIWQPGVIEDVQEIIKWLEQSPLKLDSNA